IGVMKAIGWRAQEVGRMFVVEGMLFSFMAALIGILLGWLVVLMLSQIPVDISYLTENTMPDFGSGPDTVVYTLPARLSLNAVWVALLSSSVGGGLASFLTSRRAAQIKPADALRKG
ncbi:MAG: FtsX-like permease family protein, partial [Deltaproteobacteria bacterium]|nr:FtsX-like permease family protein [Deltaproteobacteria bacterium]